MSQHSTMEGVTAVRGSRSLRLEWAWWGALAVFVLAGSTGALYRLGLTYGWTVGLDLTNVRHAHSHLMYFGWVTPLLFVLIARYMRSGMNVVLPAKLNVVIAGCFVAALISYPLFLFFGYNPVALGEKRLPIAVIGSTLNMTAWYAFVVWYIRATRGILRTQGHLLWDVALTFLMLATVGAGGLAMLKPLGIESDVWTSALTHVFLDFFSEGWFVLAVLGLAHLSLLNGGRRGGHWSIYILCLGLPLTFALGMPSILVPAELAIVARAGGILVGAGLLANVALLWPAANGERKWVWRIPLLMLALKATGQVASGILPGIWWSDLRGMRILYLHLMLLGFVSLGLAAAAENSWGRAVTRGIAWKYSAVFAVIASLILLSPLWPPALGGRWTYVTAAWLSFAPVCAAIAIIVRGTLHRRETDLSTPVGVGLVHDALTRSHLEDANTRSLR